MPLPHPDYTGLLIYDWDKGEKPKPGAFAVMKAYKGLTHLANVAYGTPALYRMINRNAWNMANLTYRRSSTNCNSQKADPQGALNDAAFIALCQADRPQWAKERGFRYAPIWIPSPEMPLPSGKKAPNKAVGVAKPLISPALLKVPILVGDRDTITPVSSSATANALNLVGRGSTVSVGAQAASPAEMEAALYQASVVPSDTKVMWVGIGLAVVAVAALMGFSKG